MRSLAAKVYRQAKLLSTDPTRVLDNIYHTLRPGVELARRQGRESESLRVYIARHQSIVENCRFASGVAPAVDVLLPSLSPGALTGGPNTAITLAYRIALAGVAVRLVAAYEAPNADESEIWTKILAITGGSERPANLTIATMADPVRPFDMTPTDLIIATFWPTAHLAQSMLDRMRSAEFLYLIQDFEPGFYPWSTDYALAEASYGLHFQPIVNERVLADFLFQQRVGRFADPRFAERCLVFNPAVDCTLFSYTERSRGPRRLLFYTRPQQPRNMFGLGLEALRRAAVHPAFAAEPWEFLALGASIPETPLGTGKVLRSLPWQDYQHYAATIRGGDILLCLMLSPHTSYPVLEMAACRGYVVTNSFANKTADLLAAISPAIIPALPDVASVAVALVEAAQRCADTDTATRGVGMPKNWREALVDVVDAITDRFWHEQDTSSAYQHGPDPTPVGTIGS
jgi:hypothetical protein